MRFSTTGRQAIWLGAGILAVAILLENTLMLLIDVCLVLFLASHGIWFRRTLQIADYSVKLESNPSHIFVKVGQPLEILITMTNSSHLKFTIDRVNLNLPVEIEKTSQDTEIELPSNGRKSIALSLTPKVAGKYDLGKSNIILRSKLGLFTASVTLPIRIAIMATPNPRGGKTAIRPEILETISVDPHRRGPGTDLAGLRPFRYSDNLHSINWRATARAGKLIVNESYLERPPQILLLIDIACLRSALEEITKLLAAPEISASSVGLILHDENKVIARVRPTAGVSNRRAILRLIVEKAGPNTPLTPLITKDVVRRYRSLAQERHALERALWFGNVGPVNENLGVLADFLLPFLRSAESKHLLRLRRQATFRAFEIASHVRERTLVLALSSGQGNLSVLFDGAVYASRAGHEVIVAILNPKSWSAARESVPDGITLITCTARELLRSLSNAILGMSRRRLDAKALEIAAVS